MGMNQRRTCTHPPKDGKHSWKIYIFPSLGELRQQEEIRVLYRTPNVKNFPKGKGMNWKEYQRVEIGVPIEGIMNNCACLQKGVGQWIKGKGKKQDNEDCKRRENEIVLGGCCYLMVRMLQLVLQEHSVNIGSRKIRKLYPQTKESYMVADRSKAYLALILGSYFLILF